MHDAAAVRGGQRVGDLRAVLERLVEAQARWQRLAGRPSPRHPPDQGFTFEVLHHEVVDAPVGPDVEQRADVAVTQRRGGAGFGFQPPPAIRVGRGIGRQDLQRHRAAQARVARPVDLAHPADGDEAIDLERAEATAVREARRRHAGRVAEGIGCGLPRRRLEQALRVPLMRQQRLDLLAEFRITGALAVEERGAISGARSSVSWHTRSICRQRSGVMGTRPSARAPATASPPAIRARS